MNTAEMLSEALHPGQGSQGIGRGGQGSDWKMTVDLPCVPGSLFYFPCLSR